MPGAVDAVHLGLVPHRLVEQQRLDDVTGGGRLGAVRRRECRRWSRRLATLNSQCATSTRKPSTPRSSQKRSTSSNIAGDVGVAPVEVGLGGVEEVEVPLGALSRAGRRVLDTGPRGPAEDRDPVVGRLRAAATLAGAEEVARALGAAGAGRQGRLEPCVLGRGVVGHQVDDHLEPEAMGRRRTGRRRRTASRSVGRRRVVGDVVAGVVLRRGVERREPQRVDPEVAEVRAAAR